MKKVCVRCQTELQENMRFCNKCGTSAARIPANNSKKRGKTVAIVAIVLLAMATSSAATIFAINGFGNNDEAPSVPGAIALGAGNEAEETVAEEIVAVPQETNVLDIELENIEADIYQATLTDIQADIEYEAVDESVEISQDEYAEIQQIRAEMAGQSRELKELLLDGGFWYVWDAEWLERHRMPDGTYRDLITYSYVVFNTMEHAVNQLGPIFGENAYSFDGFSMRAGFYWLDGEESLWYSFNHFWAVNDNTLRLYRVYSQQLELPPRQVEEFEFINGEFVKTSVMHRQDINDVWVSDPDIPYVSLRREMTPLDWDMISEGQRAQLANNALKNRMLGTWHWDMASFYFSNIRSQEEIWSEGYLTGYVYIPAWQGEPAEQWDFNWDANHSPEFVAINWTSGPLTGQAIVWNPTFGNRSGGSVQLEVYGEDPMLLTRDFDIANQQFLRQSIEGALMVLNPKKLLEQLVSKTVLNPFSH